MFVRVVSIHFPNLCTVQPNILHILYRHKNYTCVCMCVCVCVCVSVRGEREEGEREIPAN